MKILVINGSPKCERSITLHSVYYLEKCFKEDEFEILHLIKEQKKYEEDFEILKERIEGADLLLFSYPVYKYQTPYYMHRFIEKLAESNTYTKGKYAAQISTSAHFFDVTAQNFITENCNDLGINMLHKLSAGMEDLLTEKGKKELLDFWNLIKFSMSKMPNVLMISKNKLEYPVSSNTYEQSIFDDNCKTANDYIKTVLLTDYRDEDESLKNMILDFKQSYPHKVDEINLNDLEMKGGCLGCMQCATSGKCFYRDGFQETMEKTLLKADAVIYAFKIKNHSFGSRYKLFEDRLFFNGHRPPINGNTTAYLLSGSFEEEQNLKTIIHASNDMYHCFVSGIVTDENISLTKYEIENLANKTAYSVENRISVPETFYGMGGRLIFRDLVMKNRFIMKEDHEYYKSHNMYDYPNKIDMSMFLKSFGIFLMKHKNNGKNLQELMILPYKKIIEYIS